MEISLPVTWTEDGTVTAYVTYQYNNFYIMAFAPVETWHSGKHILTLYYPLGDIAASVGSLRALFLNKKWTP